MRLLHMCGVLKMVNFRGNYNAHVDDSTFFDIMRQTECIISLYGYISPAFSNIGMLSFNHFREKVKAGISEQCRLR